jgi:hypothetical protein
MSSNLITSMGASSSKVEHMVDNRRVIGASPISLMVKKKGNETQR